MGAQPGEWHRARYAGSLKWQRTGAPKGTHGGHPFSPGGVGGRILVDPSFRRRVVVVGVLLGGIDRGGVLSSRRDRSVRGRSRCISGRESNDGGWTRRGLSIPRPTAAKVGPLDGPPCRGVGWKGVDLHRFGWASPVEYGTAQRDRSAHCPLGKSFPLRSRRGSSCSTSSRRAATARSFHEGKSCSPKTSFSGSSLAMASS